MPCYTIRTTSVDLSAMGRIDVKLLVEAFNALGLSAELQADGKTIVGNNISYLNGQLTVYGKTKVNTDQVKQQYSAAIVRSQSKRFGWQMQDITNQQAKEVRR